MESRSPPIPVIRPDMTTAPPALLETLVSSLCRPRRPPRPQTGGCIRAMEKALSGYWTPVYVPVLPLTGGSGRFADTRCTGLVERVGRRWVDSVKSRRATV